MLAYAPSGTSIQNASLQPRHCNLQVKSACHRDLRQSSKKKRMPAVDLVEATFLRSGRRFEPVHELELHAGLISAASALPGASAGVLLISEMRGPIGIPDFTAIVGGKTQLMNRRATGIAPILSPLDASIVVRLHLNRPRKLSSIAADVSMSEGATSARLRTLLRSGAVCEPSPGRFTRNSALSPGGTLYAIEAKVRDWKKAAQQSRRYRVWTNNYVLALGPLSEPAQRQAMGEVAQDFAGLVVNGKWLRKPTPKPVGALNRFLAFEYVAAALFQDQPSSDMNWSSPASSEDIH